MRGDIAKRVCKPACGTDIHEEGAEGGGGAEEGRKVPAAAAHASKETGPCVRKGWAQEEEVVDCLGGSAAGRARARWGPGYAVEVTVEGDMTRAQLEDYRRLTTRERPDRCHVLGGGELGVNT